MEIFSTWMFAVTIILYNQVVCSDYSNDFEVFHTSATSGVKSQSLYPEPLYNEQSPSSGDQRFARNVFDPKNDYVGSHNAFLWKYFDKAAEYRSDESNGDDDANYGKTNDKYQQASDVEQFEKDDYYDQGYGGYGKTNDKYRQVPDAEQFEVVDHYDQADANYEYDRISSMQNQESKQNPKNCKIIAIGEMKCRVCKNAAGSHSKSCSASSTPPKQKYGYTQQRLTAYNIEDDDKKTKRDSDEAQPEEFWESDELTSIV